MEEKKIKHNESSKKYYHENKDKVLSRQKNYNKLNQEKIKEYILKNDNKYVCDKCEFHTYQKWKFNRHLSTKKHNNN